MEPLRIHTAIHSRYQVFDVSGQLPFSIVFGLCRRSPDDTDSRPLVLQTKHSALDVPYAIAHGLLTLYEGHGGSKPDTEVDLLGKLEFIDSDCDRGDETQLTLDSPVVRTKPWRDSFTVYQYRIDPKSKLASILEPGKNYTIKLTSGDLGVKSWTYSDSVHQSPDHQELAAQTLGTCKLVNSKPSAGKACFEVVSTLSHPPKTHLNLELARDDNSNNSSGSVDLLITMINPGTEPINIQTSGRQRFLVPWGPFQPEQETDDPRPRIIDSVSPTPSLSLRVIDTATGEAVREPRKPGPCGPLYDSRTDPRPQLQSLVTLLPGQPLVRRVDITKLVSGLVDGNYRVEMVSRGAWWCFGSREEISDEGDGRVSRRFYSTMVPPLVLETDDVVYLQIEGGIIVR